MDITNDQMESKLAYYAVSSIFHSLGIQRFHHVTN